MVVLTDGYSSPDPPAAAATAKADGIEVYVIAVGDSVNTAELQAVASDPDTKYYHHAPDEAAVEVAYDHVFEEIVCDPPEEECTGEPLDVGLVIDRSGSMAGARIDAAKAGSKKFLDKLSTTADQSGLVSFQSSTTLDKSLDFDHAGTKSAVDALAAGGGTNMAPAIDASHSDIDLKARPTARQVMVVLTDGFSAPDPPAAAATAKAGGIEVYVIAVGDSVNEAELKDVASDPDTKYYHHASTDVEVEAAYDTVFSRIKCEDTPCPPDAEVTQEERPVQEPTPKAQPLPVAVTVTVQPVDVDALPSDCLPPPPECVDLAALEEVLRGLGVQADSVDVNTGARLPVAKLCPGPPPCLVLDQSISVVDVQDPGAPAQAPQPGAKLCLPPVPPVSPPPVDPVDPVDPVEPVDPVWPCVVLPAARRSVEVAPVTLSGTEARASAGDVRLCLRAPVAPRSLEIGGLADLRPVVFLPAETHQGSF